MPLRLELAPEDELIVENSIYVFQRNGIILEYDSTAPPGKKVLLKAAPNDGGVQGIIFFLTISFDFLLLLLLLFSFFVFAERKEKNFFSRQYIF